VIPEKHFGHEWTPVATCLRKEQTKLCVDFMYIIGIDSSLASVLQSKTQTHSWQGHNIRARPCCGRADCLDSAVAVSSRIQLDYFWTVHEQAFVFRAVPQILQGRVWFTKPFV